MSKVIENFTVQITEELLGGKTHGSLARAGKVRKQTPKVPKQECLKKKLTGRAKRRMQYKKRFAANDSTTGKRRSPNSNQ